MPMAFVMMHTYLRYYLGIAKSIDVSKRLYLCLTHRKLLLIVVVVRFSRDPTTTKHYIAGQAFSTKAQSCCRIRSRAGGLRGMVIAVRVSLPVRRTQIVGREGWATISASPNRGRVCLSSLIAGD